VRHIFFIVWLGIAIAGLSRAPRSADAATIEGCIVDSDGKLLAGAEVANLAKAARSQWALGRSAD
jgi:hypothetical protein